MIAGANCRATFSTVFLSRLRGYKSRRMHETIVVIGLIVGLGSAFGLGRLLTTQLYQVSPNNPMLLALAAGILAFVALIACLFPAHRATLVNPIDALRTE